MAASQIYQLTTSETMKDILMIGMMPQIWMKRITYINSESLWIFNLTHMMLSILLLKVTTLRLFLMIAIMQAQLMYLDIHLFCGELTT